ncbi:MAG: hypothetical protein LC749_22330 [Actinobacteria bacterium]|nr:hypothetical protein [Actinomycetota bacterium]
MGVEPIKRERPAHRGAADLRRVRVLREGWQVADPERILVNHQTITDPEHLTAAQALWRERLKLVRQDLEADVEVQYLADYHTALGLDDGGVV